MVHKPVYLYTPRFRWDSSYNVLYFATPSLIFEATSLRQLSGLTSVPKIACLIA